MTGQPQVPLPDRFYDDYSIGEQFTLGSVTVEEDEILEFASRFDPQPFHVDPIAARDTVFGGLIASGWHTGSLMMRLLCDHVLGAASMGSPGLDELRWPAPVRPGDTLTLQVEVLAMRPSASKPDRGIIQMAHQMVNQDDVVVIRSIANMMIARRAG
jgi:acyl dehydratase